MSDPEPQLKLYVKPGCPWCAQVSGYLKKEGYRFQELDVIRNDHLFREMREISGQTYAPTMTRGDLVLADFDVTELQAFLEKHDITP